MELQLTQEMGWGPLSLPFGQKLLLLMQPHLYSMVLKVGVNRSGPTVWLAGLLATFGRKLWPSDNQASISKARTLERHWSERKCQCRKLYTHIEQGETGLGIPTRKLSAPKKVGSLVGKTGNAREHFPENQDIYWKNQITPWGGVHSEMFAMSEKVYTD